MATYRIKHMSKTYLPETITHLGIVFKRYNSLDVSGVAKNLQELGKRVIVLSVLSKNLKGRTDLYGKPYQPIRWIFFA